MFVVHYGYIDDGLHYTGELWSTRELAFAAAKKMASEEFNSVEQEVVFDEDKDGITASGINYEDDEAVVTVPVTELEVDSGRIFYGEIK